MATKLLEGIVADVADDHRSETSDRRETQRLEDENRSLRHQLEDVERERDRMARSMEILRSNLSPLHRALRILFGEIELSIGEEKAGSLADNPHTVADAIDPRWASYKKAFSPTAGEIIDALLIHNEMKIRALARLTKHHPETVRQEVVKLRDAGAVNYMPGSGVVSLKR